MVQRGHYFAIVDEVDSILIDEARTPLIISGPLEDVRILQHGRHASFPKLVEEDYELDEKQRSACFTEAGNEKIEACWEAGLLKGRLAVRRRERRPRPPRQPGAEGPQAVPARQGLHRQGRRSRHHRRVHRPHDAGPALLRRPAPGAGSQGGVRIQPENQTLASITFQNYFRMYDKLAGMTGTASTEADEFADIYKLEVVEIPTNVPVSAYRRRRRGLPHGRGEIPPSSS
jgi:preprotein translocase subunit SecA